MLVVDRRTGCGCALKVPLGADDPHVATVSGIWPAANWLEREVWDLFGIAFDGHPDPRRLLMPEDWEGYPLRKDYPVQIRMTPNASEALQVTEEEFRAEPDEGSADAWTVIRRRCSTRRWPRRSRCTSACGRRRAAGDRRRGGDQSRR